MKKNSTETICIVTDTHDEYDIKWVGKILDSKPQFKNGKPIFIIIGTGGRIEVNTTNMVKLEEYAKLLTHPKGREAVTTDSSRIYIKEENGNEKLLCVVFHNHIKDFTPITKKVEDEKI